MFKPKMIENENDFCCSKGHKLPVLTIAVDPNLSRNQRLLCSECLENTDMDAKVIGLKKIISLIEENQVNKMEKLQNIINSQINVIESLHCVVDQMKSNVIQKLNQLINIIIEWIQNLQQQRSQYSQYSFYEELENMLQKENKTNSSQQILIHEIQETNLCWASKFHPQLEHFNQFGEYNKCRELLSSLELGSDKLIQIEQQQQQINIQEIKSVSTLINIEPSQTIESSHQYNLNTFNYQLIQEYSISQYEFCCAIAVDNYCSTLVAGCNSIIKVFQFNQGKINQIQSLNEHKDWVLTLNFMKKSKQFISGSQDKSIIIWKLNQNNEWSSQQILNGHISWIECLVINTNEDLIISGSQDATIKFWIKKNEWLCQQTIIDHSKSVNGLSLNQQQNRILSCGIDEFILIIEQSGQNTEWRVLQKITVEKSGWRVCFIDNNTFMYSPGGKEQISFFEMNINNKQFTKTRDILIQSGIDCNPRFPQQYINSKRILMSKNGEYVNLIRQKQNGEFLTEQSIHFGISSLYGAMTDDGEYLITWDRASYQIQIRRYQEQ
ncbi:unnamed protein product [Paramecium sonneborni]|uniref:WD40 repeat-containing protein n=1 Tax=Paramecium sonneborni TaxID=65129 RepID=A0A8S1RUH1_9CILI|nr:unnamed protein product [Paramecium sonneborni]